MAEVWKTTPSLAWTIEDVDQLLIFLERIIEDEGTHIEEFDA